MYMVQNYVFNTYSFIASLISGGLPHPKGMIQEEFPEVIPSFLGQI